MRIESLREVDSPYIVFVNAYTSIYGLSQGKHGIRTNLRLEVRSVPMGELITQHTKFLIGWGTFGETLTIDKQMSGTCPSERYDHLKEIRSIPPFFSHDLLECLYRRSAGPLESLQRQRIAKLHRLGPGDSLTGARKRDAG